MLLGPIMEEFKQKKNDLIQSAHTLMVAALGTERKTWVTKPLDMKITVQGGVGTSKNMIFCFKLPCRQCRVGISFLLVPEATSVDTETPKPACTIKTTGFYLSNISPLGVPFNTVRGTSNEILKYQKESQRKIRKLMPKNYWR
jgi:hypothetical protein